jgi:hypothetical protein
MALGSVSPPVGRRQAGEFPGVSMPNLRESRLSRGTPLRCSRKPSVVLGA